MHWWVTQECREGRRRVGSGSGTGGGGSEGGVAVAVEVEVGDGCEIGRVQDGEAAVMADGGSAGESRRGHQTDVPYSGAKAATWSSMRGTSGTWDSRLVGQIASGSGSLRRDESGVDLVWSPGRLVSPWRGLEGQKGQKGPV